MTVPGDRVPGLSARLEAAATALRRVPGDAFGPVRLGYAFNAFFQARIVAVVLDAESVPARDAYALAEGWCTKAMDLLFDVAGRQVVRRYCPDHAGGEALMERVATAARFELFTASDEDVERISAQMIELAAELKRFLTSVDEDESLMPAVRGAARLTAPLAHLTWAHFGGDSGGW